MIELNIHGIKCDVCDFKDMSITKAEYPAMVDAPCPRCGANLLTKADMAAILKMERFCRVVNFLFGWLPWVKNKPMVYSAPMEMDGSGKMQIGKVKRDQA